MESSEPDSTRLDGAASGSMGVRSHARRNSAAGGNGIGARAIGVATGSYSVAELRRAGGDDAFETLESFTEVVDAVLA